MAEVNQPEYKVIAWSEFAEKYEQVFEMPFEELLDDLAEIRLYEADANGNVCFPKDLEIDDEFNAVIDGNLVVSGNFSLDCEYGGFVFVKGNMRADSIMLSGVASLHVAGNVDVKHGIVGYYGDDGGYLSVGGETTAPVIINDTYFNMDYSGAVNAVVINTSNRELDADYDEDDFSEAVNAELVDDGTFDIQKVRGYLVQGKPILKKASTTLSQSDAEAEQNYQKAELIPVTAREALERFPILDDTIHSYGSETDYVLVCEGDASYPGDLVMDFHDKAWHNREDGEKATGIIFNGNLTVEGSVINMEGDFGPFLLVLGNLEAQNIDKGGSEFYITGDCNVSNVVYGYYNHGSLMIDGQIKAAFLIEDDHCIEPGQVHQDTVTINNYSDYGDFDYYAEDIPRTFVKEVLDEDGEKIDSTKFIERLNEGKKVMKPGAKPSRVIVEEYIQEIAENDEAITKLELNDKKLKQFPRNVLRIKSLKILDLSSNPIGKIPEDIEQLENLEELYLERCGLTELPESIGKLSRLRVLDVSHNSVSGDELELPDTLAGMVNLKVLKINYNKGFNLPLSLTKLALEELEAYQCSEAKPIEFPEIICQLTSLKILELSSNSFKTIPESFLKLINLEELRLNSSLCYLKTLPDLTQLPNLRILAADGNICYTERPYCSQSLLKHFFAITTLEKLYIDRHGKKSGEVCGPLLAEHLQGIGNLKNLKELDLSFNDLAEVPEDFWELKKLEVIDLKYNCMPQELRERIAKEFPQTKIDFRNQRVEEAEPEKLRSKEFAAMNELVKQGNDKRYPATYHEAIAHYDQALEFYQSGKVTDEYNLIYIHYSKMWVYSRMAYQLPELTEAEKRQYKELCVTEAWICLDMVPANMNVWHFTDEGQFHQEVIRYASNCIAWNLYENNDDPEKLEEALNIVERGVTFASEPAYFYIRDTKVRVLLKLGKTKEAYALVQRTLNVQPDFGDFQDFKSNKAYLEWEKE
jgi:Leucine-rich repeat (LRR) protein